MSSSAKEIGVHWPKTLLPICSMGCAIQYCIDTESLEVIIWEPTYWKKHRPVKTAMFGTGVSFVELLEGWSNGTDLFDLVPDNVRGFEDIGKLETLYQRSPPAPRSRRNEPNQLNLFDDS